MSVLQEVKQLKGQGLSQEQIIRTLRDKKVPYKDISNALAQSDIKAAVEQPSESESQDTPPLPDLPTKPGQADMSAMQPSQMYQQPKPEIPTPTPSDAPSQQPFPVSQEQQGAPQMPPSFPQPTQEYNPQDQQPAGYNQSQQTQGYDQSQQLQGYDQSQQYPQNYEDYSQQGYDQGYEQQGYDQGYSSYSGNVSSDTIAEIAEQVVAQKLSDIRKPLEKVIDFRTTVETKIEGVEERLKRIESIIHTLQSSVLGKVGEYITNIDDIKKELIQTQKTFAKVHKHKKTTKKKKSSKK